MPVYEFGCNKCQHEWEDLFNINDPMPNKCPACKSIKIKRLISLISHGVVELTGHELKSKLRQDAVKMKQEAAKNENVMASLVGEDKLHKNELVKAELKRERPKIKTSRKKSS